MTFQERYPRYRAPTGNREVLCEPPWNSLGELLRENREQLDSFQQNFGGLSFGELRSMARSSLLNEAGKFTSAYADFNVAKDDNQPLVLTGHQPGLHHAGVWLKNFAAARIAKEWQGTAVNLIIDSDLCRSTSVAIPTGATDEPRISHVAYDQATTQMAFEERDVLDRETWRTFGDRAATAISPLVNEPMLRNWWPRVASAGKPANLGIALSQARHQLEIEWGVESLELPLSAVCRGEAFQRFAAHLMLEAEPFRQAYNEALAEYRQAHRLRNSAQPVPDLAAHGGWIETPLWIWTAEDPTRHPLFVKYTARELALRGGNGEQYSVASSGDPNRRIVGLLEDMESRGVKVRSRALITTMFARLFLADLFIHGIGGAKYDQVTDHISQTVFGITPPRHATVTGTLRLPVPHATADPLQVRKVEQKLRDLRYHPEATIDVGQLSATDQQRLAQLAEQKRMWINTAKTVENCTERHRSIDRSNVQMQNLATHQHEELSAELKNLQRQLQVNRVLDSREYPACLFPQEDIHNFLLDFHAPMP